MAGTFVALEGPKGVGKTHVCNLVAATLADAGIAGVVLTKEPTPGFDLHSEERLHGHDLALAIADDRASHLAELIEPALRHGDVVLCDRYILSSLVFHCADGVSPEAVWQLNAEFPLPDINMLLCARVERIQSRRLRRQTLTRLETSRDPADEATGYLRHGREMESRGVGLHIFDNNTPEDAENVVQSVVDFIASVKR